MILATPHDHLIKYALKRQEGARDFILNYLPPEISGQFDLSTLAIRKDSFIDEKLAEHFSDILYEVELLNGQISGIYLLFEHKSFPKRQTIFDLLRYMVRIWLRQIEQRTKREKLVLKPILPIIIYHSPKEWASPISFHDLFSEELPEELKQFVPHYRVHLCDLSQFSDSDIKGEVLLRIVFMIFKHLYTGELLERLPSILALLDQLEDKKTGLEYLSVLLRYLSAQKVVPMNTKQLKTVVEEALPKGGDIMLSLAEQWIQEGVEEGKKQGKKEGIEEGKKQGKKEGIEEGKKQGIKQGERSTLREMFLRLLEGRFGSVPVGLMLRTEKLLTEQLKRLFDLAINATSLDEIEQAMTA
jgi:predicted transposase/invertase (TIGR01784 family)